MLLPRAVWFKVRFEGTLTVREGSNEVEERLSSEAESEDLNDDLLTNRRGRGFR